MARITHYTFLMEENCERSCKGMYTKQNFENAFAKFPCRLVFFFLILFQFCSCFCSRFVWQVCGPFWSSTICWLGNFKSIHLKSINFLSQSELEIGDEATFSSILRGASKTLA